MNMGIRRLMTGLAFLVVLVLLAAACGGDDDSSEGSDDGSQQSEAEDGGDTADTDAGEEASGSTDDGGDEPAPEPEPAEEEEQPAPETQGSGIGSERAIVTIGDETFEFDMSVGCIALGGAVGGFGITADGLVTADFDIPPEDWETSGDDWGPPGIRVQDDRLDDSQAGVHHPDWRADEEWSRDTPELAGATQVESYTVNGPAASGTATFTDTWAHALGKDAPPVPGTFEINCG
ncbi:MAG: hypothetical protein ACR2PK_18585 [Acidimicrobiales bacterium]